MAGQWLSLKASPNGITGGVDVADVDAGAVLADCLNVRLDRPQYAWTRRPGSRAYNPITAPLGNADWDLSARIRKLVWWRRADGSTRLVAFVETGVQVDQVQLYVNNPAADKTFTAVGDPFQVSGIPSTAILFDRIWIATGQASGGNRVFDGTSLGAVSYVAGPAAAPTLLSSNSGKLEGDYTYVYCYRNDTTLARSRLSAEASITLAAAKKCQVTVTNSTDSDADTIEVYRTTAGGNVLRRVKELANDTAGGTQLFLDNTEDSDLSFITAPQRSGQLPSCRLVTAWRERLWWAGRTEAPADPNAVYWSEALHPYNVDPARNALPVQPDDNDILRAQIAVGEQLYQLKHRHIYAITEVAAGEYRCDPVITEQDCGPVSHATVCMTRGGAMWLSRTGVCLFNGVSVTKIEGPLKEWMSDQAISEAEDLEAGAGATYGWPAVCTFRNTDIVTESFHFVFRFYRDAELTDLALTRSTQVAGDRPYVLVNGAVALEDGTPINAGQRVTLQVAEEGLTESSYYWTAQAFDGLEWTAEAPQGSYVRAPTEIVRRNLSINLASLDRYWAIDYDPLEQYWLGVQGRASQDIDQVWVLDYGQLLDGGGPSWWRYSLFATCGCVSLPVSIDGSTQSIWPLLGDPNGMIWLHQAPGGIEHDTGIAYTAEQRAGVAALVNNEDGTWTLSRAGMDWPASEGQVVVIRDGDDQYYTALVCGSTATTLTLRAWHEGRYPLDGDVDYWLGGIAGHIDTLWLPSEEPQSVKQWTELEIVRGEPARRLYLEVRGSSSPDDLRSASRRRWRRKARTVPPVVDRTSRLPIGLRGRLFSLRLGSPEPGAEWMVRELRLRIEPTAGRM